MFQKAITVVNGQRYFHQTFGSKLIVLEKEKLNRNISYIQKNLIKSIFISQDYLGKESNLDFFKDIPFIEDLIIQENNYDYNPLYNLKNLKWFSNYVKNKKQRLDFSQFTELIRIDTDWYDNISSFEKNTKMETIILNKFKPKSQLLNEVKLPKNLTGLSLIQSNITNVDGINLPNLKQLQLLYCNKMLSLKGIENMSNELRTVIIENCTKLNDYSQIENARQLENLVIGSSGAIPNLNWLKELNKVKHFSFWGTKLIDGDLSNCFGIDNVTFMNSKHYNFKEKDFGKKIDGPIKFI